MDTSLFPPKALPQRKTEESGLPEPPRKIIVLHNDDPYRAELCAYLRDQNFAVEEFTDPQAAFDRLVGDEPVDTILIDVDLAQMRGIALFLRLCNLGIRTPIALCAEKYDQLQEDKALEYGAAEYFCKSRRFSIIARRLSLLVDGVRARSTLSGSTADVISVGPLDVRLRSHRASWRGREVPLTVTEFKIVRLLTCHCGEEISYRDIYDMVHGSGFFAGEGPQGYRINVRSLIRKIRDRFRAIDLNFAEIENCPGIGYRWRSSADARHIDSAVEFLRPYSIPTRSATEPSVWRNSMTLMPINSKVEG